MNEIKILEPDSNKRGDLFGRLMADLFVALGYEQPRINIHKSGREIDLDALHRLERRRAIAECKATVDTIGGGDLNKFVGALDVEREDQLPTTGYFISLSGFKQTAIEQEKTRRTKITLLDGPQIVEELILGRILIPKAKATELAGRICAGQNSLALDEKSELLAHERGWIWAIYWTTGKCRTHFALIHADGTPLARVLAEEIIASDKSCNGQLHELTCLNPTPNGVFSDLEMATAQSAYSRYLAEECGFIHLDGLPADSEVGSRRMRLENLFVPLHLDVTRYNETAQRMPVGIALAEHPQLAILAAPGGGKSTLIKRLAVAYADSERRGQVEDYLAPTNYLPLFFRCRELRDLARGSFADLIEALSQREPVRQHSSAFRALVDSALVEKRILLLVDGLDEIADAGDRAAFVCTLRSALLAYPGTAFVVTSREAGFRHVAAHLAPICTQATLSSFNADDISKLTVAWHCEVVGDTEKVRTDAELLAATIAANDRIERLAVNPLLLTTLLLVKRWVGSLPTRRAVLYGKAVEVLLMTWNTEGHAPIPEEEALPQLCYVAATMMMEKIERISRPRLAALLQEARDALPTELGYVQGSVDDFIHRVEDRSSLLMMTGHDVEDGRLVEFFEFRHLTFQEFLTARAMVEGWHPGVEEADSLVDVLENFFEDEKWREVIPLAAALGGKATDTLIARLTSNVSDLKQNEGNGSNSVMALANCLADEAQAKPATIRAALRELVRFSFLLHDMPSTPSLAKGKYGTDFREEARNAVLATTVDLNIGYQLDVLLVAVYHQMLPESDVTSYKNAAKQALDMLYMPETIQRIEGALCLGRLAFDLKIGKNTAAKAAQQILISAGSLLEKMVFPDIPAEICSAIYALHPIWSSRVWMPEKPLIVLARVVELWMNSKNETIKGLAVRILALHPIVQRDLKQPYKLIEPSVFKEFWGNVSRISTGERFIILRLAYYQQELEDEEIIKIANNLLEAPYDIFTNEDLSEQINELLGLLGVPHEPDKSATQPTLNETNLNNDKLSEY